ncbi:helix-turn-helix transcriptional regulator [Sinorhizobium numidicum]|uniref:Helix-turn-helix transcriptional regulator n=1 Tax=Sinorhizobium numidicum TaxID=680248 RepID=A0ABY8CPR3_9HYPH|nr:winged helix-turn-helix domain-containing protein [Sinorhizobium numidicum]WEX74653.1 helix-turn-helix transcriptional regulator [Sinorhizobium numidicum]WEX80644.1 helix-turn-helix transcriptional regulator [Sinorhizobium numidicum]
MTQSASETISFGAFSLNANERLLLRDGAPVELGSRAFDILVVLTGRPNEVVSKKELLDRVWPDVIVEEGSLRFHIANLRKALGDGKESARYISTLSGRGYCFVAPVQRSSQGDDVPGEVAASFPKANLPGRLVRMVGRADDTAVLSALLAEKRFVTIVGTGGIGKTTVAVAAGHNLVRSFDGAVHFVDLGALADPCQVAATVASTLGISFQSEDLVSALATYLADKRILLILDTCEHVIEAAADLAYRIFSAAPQVHLLATSRQPLNVEGEHVYKLAPLACPPDEPDLTATMAQGFPAIELFMERAAASGARLDLDDADAAVVATICRKLDGVPLAIELAAGRVASYGIQKTATLLNERLSLLWTGQRTAPPRQRTLQATLDWSSNLLSEFERRVLRRLAVFVGHFAIDAALAVVTNASIDETIVFEAFDSLVAKSMVATRPAGATMRYRLLDTTRAYALQLDIEEAEFADLAARHAIYYMRWLEETGGEWPTLSSAAQRALHLDGLANVRAALDWCFGPTGNTQVGIRLAAAAAPVFLSMSLLTECHRWTARAMEALDDATRGGREEMHLRAAMGVSLMFTHGGRDAARVALERSLAIAEERGDGLDQLQVLGPLQMFHLRTGEFRVALDYAERCSALAEALEDCDSATLAYSLMGISLHLNGDFGRARTALEAALRTGPRSNQTTTNYLGFDGRILAGAILARTLWLQGLSDQAVEQALRTIADAETLDHPLTLSIALVWAVSVFLWVGDLERADKHTDRLLSTAALHSLRPYLAVGRGFMGELAIRRGDTDKGIVSLRHCIRELHKAPYELLSTPLTLSLLEGLAAAGRVTEALALVDETIQSVEANGDLCYSAELLRVKGGLVVAASQSDSDDAEKCLTRSLEVSRCQGARAWELRTTTYLATLLADRDERESARELLQPVFEQFVKDPNSADLKSAARLLATLGSFGAID